MKTKGILCGVLAVGLLGSFTPGCATSQARLEAQAKVSRADAEKIALTKAPGGTIKEGELEKEHGKLVWSFDIAMPGTKTITEVHVDAVTGQIVRVENESPADQEKEAKEKAHEKK